MPRQWRDLNPNVPSKPGVDSLALPWNKSSAGPHFAQPLSLYSEETLKPTTKMYNNYPRGAPDMGRGYPQGPPGYPQKPHGGYNRSPLINKKYQKPLLIFVALLAAVALAIGLAVGLSTSDPEFIQKSYVGTMTIGDDSGFMFTATLNVANDPDRAEYEDWFCAQIRANFPGIGVQTCAIGEVSEGSIVTPYEIKLAAVHEAQLTGAEGTLGSAMTFKNKDGDADTMTSNNEIRLEGATTAAAEPADSEEEVTTTVPGDDTTDPS